MDPAPGHERPGSGTALAHSVHRRLTWTGLVGNALGAVVVMGFLVFLTPRTVVDDQAVLERGIPVFVGFMVIGLRWAGIWSTAVPTCRSGAGSSRGIRRPTSSGGSSSAILRHGGHANKFIGDGLLAIFGAPERLSDHADRAVAAGLEIADVVRRRYDGRLRVGVGVNSGRAVVGTIGGGGASTSR